MSVVRQLTQVSCATNHAVKNRKRPSLYKKSPPDVNPHQKNKGGWVSFAAMTNDSRPPYCLTLGSKKPPRLQTVAFSFLAKPIHNPLIHV